MRLILASNLKIVCEALSRLLIEAGLEVAEVVDSLDKTSSIATLGDTDVIILTDPAFNNPVLANLQRLHSLNKNIGIVLLAVSKAQVVPISMLFKYSVRSILPVDCTVDELCIAARTAGNGRNFVTQSVAQLLAADLGKPQKKRTTLSAREEEVLMLIAQGLSTNEIGKMLSLSPKTISTHKSNLKSRLNLNSTSDIVRFAIENGWIDVRLKG